MKNMFISVFLMTLLISIAGSLKADSTWALPTNQQFKVIEDALNDLKSIQQESLSEQEKINKFVKNLEAKRAQETTFSTYSPRTYIEMVIQLSKNAKSLDQVKARLEQQLSGMQYVGGVWGRNPAK